MNLRCFLLLSWLLFVSTRVVTAAEAPSPGPEVIRGPFFSATVRGPKTEEAIAMKGIVVTVGAEKNAWICFDADLLRVSMAWTGEFLEFGNTQSQIAWPPPPQVKGTPLFRTQSGPGWANAGLLTDPRANHQGPLPKDWGHYEGVYQDGDTVVLKYRVGKNVVLEKPDFARVGTQPLFSRTLQFQNGSRAQTLVVADGLKSESPSKRSAEGAAMETSLANGKKLFVAVEGASEGSMLEATSNGQLLLHLNKIRAHRPFRISLSGESFVLSAPYEPKRLDRHLKGGPELWSQRVTTQGVLGTPKDGYAVDTITEPTENPYFAKTFFGGFDFFKDGRAAICTFHGDVWIVSGLNDSLQKLTWKRYATGLFQPLGLKIVKEKIYVLGRDQISILHDLNGNGEADYYENFNNDTIVTPNYHEFCLDLHTDTEGNFYFAKGAPWEPAVTSPHQGCLFKVSKDGSKLEIVATGFRAPNGMTVGPRGEITVSDNQGHWMPSSKLNWVEPGGFYGMVPAAQKTIQFARGGTNFMANPSLPAERTRFAFKGWDADAPIPLAYDEPFVWVPMYADNSSGGQLWVTSDRMGPLNESLLFMSYGKCTLFTVLPDKVNGVRQGAMYQLPLKFKTGVMRGRVHPKDGQVYLSGLKGWQTSATRDGSFYRVRHTGNAALQPTAFQTLHDGIKLTFSSPLDPSSADVENFSAEAWNYLYSGGYGSPEVSVKKPTDKKHDPVEISAVTLDKDGRSLLIRFKSPTPSDQLKLRYQIKPMQGEAISQEIFATIHAFPAQRISQN